MKNTGLAKKEKIDVRDIYISELEFGDSKNKTRWGMSDSDIKKLKRDNQRKHGTCVGQTGAKMMEKLDGKDHSARYAYVNTDKIYERSNKGGLQTINMFKFLSTFGIVRESVCEDDNRLDFEEYYNDTPSITVKGTKKKITGYVRVDANIESIKKAFDNFEILSISVRGFKTSRVRHEGKRIRRFIRDPKHRGGHAMMLTHMELIDGKYYVYMWNSWGDGPAMLALEDFPQTSLWFYAGTTKKIIGKEVIKAVDKKVKALPKYKYFSANEVKNLPHEFVLVLDKARGIAGIPFSINSGFRTVSRNKSVGGVTNSAHLKGLAVDLRARNGREIYTIVYACMQAGIKRIGVNWEKKFVHVDIDMSKPNPTIYKY